MSREADEIVVVPRKELDEKKELIKSLEAKGQKMKSDFSRYKERVEDREEAIRGKAYGELAKRLLSVVDTLDRAKNSYKTDSGCEVVEKMAEGMRSNLEITFNQLLNALEVTSIAPSAGERFNDELHTAIETTPNDFLPDKTIVSLVRKGYMLDDELIRPAEVVISRGGEAGAEAKYKPESILSKFFSVVESKVFKRKFKELEEREQELSKNEKMLQTMVKELDTREGEFKERIEEWTKRKEAEESRIYELEQRKEVLIAELEGSKRQLRIIHENLNALDAKKDKVVIESITLNRYNEELLADKEKLSNAIGELERTKESVNADLREIEERKARSIEELFKVEEELQKTKELLNAELKENEEREEGKGKELSFTEFEMPC